MVYVIILIVLIFYFAVIYCLIFCDAYKYFVPLAKVILNDPFLGKHVEDGNLTTVPLRDEFLENARLFIFESYCRIHQCIDIR